MRYLAMIALIAVTLGGGLLMIRDLAATAAAHQRAALCHTDSECLALCRKDDADCDGGPRQ